MENNKDTTLEEINKTLKEINSRQELSELFGKSDRRVENSLNQIQNSFDRIHDRAFNFNNILLGAYLVLGTFPNESPKLELWTIIFPLIILSYLIFIEYRQMEIHRFASREQQWTSVERDEYISRIKGQTLYSLFGLVLSVLCLAYLIFNLA
ncbi:hypothetical protein OB69_08550 [Roseivirga seohaensis subsp. aquiponti]|uniref:DUF202 domain-containing protein n=1 Tax=Roseivirga seohaensis subsp. aquiponti TaxID=1566026 RepID=A0A0L8AMC0_9BACT|nr:hypothetical protein [Roseivirga seohaensis]KOF03325.1 hypothetical protein OB69_08550 [Roseivirga seohaensis subsp. aquiponti]